MIIFGITVVSCCCCIFFLSKIPVLALEIHCKLEIVAAAFNSFVFLFARAFCSVIFAFILFISLSRNQDSVFFSHKFVLFSPLLHAYNLTHFIISIAMFQHSRSNLTSTLVSSFFLLPSQTTFVSIFYLRLITSVSSLYLFITCNLGYFILFYL